MNNKMRVGRKRSDGTWSGAIGAYLEFLELNAKLRNKGRDAGRPSGAPGASGKRIRTRTLRLLAKVARDAGIEWMHELKPEHWAEAFLAVMKEAEEHPRIRGEVKPNTVNGYLASLKAFAGYAASRGAMRGGALDEIFKLLPPKRATDDQAYLIIPGQQWETLFDRARSRHLVEVVFIALAVFTGMRASEIRRLTWGHLKLGMAREATFPRDKRDGEKHTVPLRKELVAILLEWQTWLMAKCGVESIPDWWYVVPGRLRGGAKFLGGGRHMQPDWPVVPTAQLGATTATRMAKKAARELGFTDEEMFNQACHIFRRSCGEYIYRESGDIRHASIALGHGSRHKPNTDTTMKYLGHGVSNEDLRAIIDSIKINDGSRPALPSGGSVIEVGLDDVIDPVKQLPIEPEGRTLEEIITDISTNALWNELVKRQGLESILIRLVKRTESLPEDEQVLMMRAYRKAYVDTATMLQEWGHAIDWAQERAMIAA